MCSNAKIVALSSPVQNTPQVEELRMSDSSNESKDQTPTTVGKALDALIKAAIPPSAKQAVASLLFGGSRAATSWLSALEAKGDLVTQKLRGETELARLKSLTALAAHVTGPEGLMARSSLRQIADGMRQQENREAVAEEALDLLSEKPPDENVAGVEEDWLNVFGRFAEQASSERVRKHWAAVLAGQIRRPGSISYMSLHTLSVIDENIARLVKKYRLRVMDRSIPFTKRFNFRPEYRELLLLEEAGLIITGRAKRYEEPMSNDVYLVGNVPLFVSSPGRLQVPASLLTLVGMEIFQLAETGADLEFVGEVIELLTNSGATNVSRTPFTSVP